MAKIHFVLQGKGGVGKSFVASILYQYLNEKGLQVSGFDTDPVNASFAGYKSFHNITAIEIMDGNRIDERRFDELIEEIYRKPSHEHVVIDNGSATFIPLCDYLIENEGLLELEALGHEIYLHVVLTGGQALTDTLEGFQSVIDNFQQPVVLWLNTYFGELVAAGVPFEDFKIFKENLDYVLAIINLPQYGSSVLRKEMEEFMTMKESFSSFINGSAWLMRKTRIKRYWHKIIYEIDKAKII